MATILAGNMDHGYLLMHRALDEDERRWGPQPNTPAHALVSLNAGNVSQFFRSWVLAQAARIEEHLQSYNTAHQRNLSFNDVKKRFLHLMYCSFSLTRLQG